MDYRNEPDEDKQIVLRDKGLSFVQPILEELIKTEETYVKNLSIRINNYGKIFERKDLRPGLRSKKYVLQQFINTLFQKHREYEMKLTIESYCRLEKKLRNILITTNESEIIKDIVGKDDVNELNTFYQGKFRKFSEIHCLDHTLKRGYRTKVFIFDKCIIYTEIKGKQMIFHGLVNT